MKRRWELKAILIMLGQEVSFKFTMIPMPNILILCSVGLVIAIIISKRSQANSVTFCVVFGLENRLYCKNKALLMGKCLI